MKPALSACYDVINILTQYTVNNTDIFIMKGWEPYEWGNYKSYKDYSAHRDLVEKILPISLEVHVARLMPICFIPTEQASYLRDFAMWGPEDKFGNKPYYVVKFRHWVPALGGSIRIETYNVENLKVAKELIDDYRKLRIKKYTDINKHKDEVDAFINKWEQRSIELCRKVRMGQDF